MEWHDDVEAAKALQATGLHVTHPVLRALFQFWHLQFEVSLEPIACSRVRA